MTASPDGLRDAATHEFVAAVAEFVAAVAQPVQVLPEPDEVLDLRAAALLLVIHPDTLRKAAGDGRLPGMKVGNQWRFSRRALLDWLGGVTS